MARRWLDQVTHVRDELSRYAGPIYRRLFEEELACSMVPLKTDRSAAAQIRASVTYNMVVEGVLAETGYHGFRRSLQENGLLPGLLEGVTLVARDESRHIRYGVFLLNRLINEDPAGWEVMNQRMNELLGPALGLINEFWEGNYDPDDGPFGQTMTTFVEFASTQFDKRMKVLERDRGKAIAEIERAALEEIDAEELAGRL